MFIQESNETVIQEPNGISYAIPIKHSVALLKKVRLELTLKTQRGGFLALSIGRKANLRRSRMKLRAARERCRNAINNFSPVRGQLIANRGVLYAEPKHQRDQKDHEGVFNHSLAVFFLH